MKAESHPSHSEDIVATLGGHDSDIATVYPDRERRCCFGIPLAVRIPGEHEHCPYSGESRASFYRLINQGILLRYRTKGLKEGVATVFGPSVCDAKYGCRCGLRSVLEELRAEATRKDGPA